MKIKKLTILLCIILVIMFAGCDLILGPGTGTTPINGDDGTKDPVVDPDATLAENLINNFIAQLTEDQDPIKATITNYIAIQDMSQSDKLDLLAPHMVEGAVRAAVGMFKGDAYTAAVLQKAVLSFIASSFDPALSDLRTTGVTLADVVAIFSASGVKSLADNITDAGVKRSAIADMVGTVIVNSYLAGIVDEVVIESFEAALEKGLGSDVIQSMVAKLAGPSLPGASKTGVIELAAETILHYYSDNPVVATEFILALFAGALEGDVVYDDIVGAITNAVSEVPDVVSMADLQDEFDIIVKEEAPSITALRVNGTAYTEPLAFTSSAPFTVEVDAATTWEKGLTFELVQLSGPMPDAMQAFTVTEDQKSASTEISLSDDGTYKFEVVVRNKEAYLSAVETFEVTLSIEVVSAADHIQRGINRLINRNYDGAYTEFALAYDMEPTMPEARVWMAFMELTSIPTDAGVIDLMQNRIGLVDYPSTLNDLYSDNWFNQEWYWEDYYDGWYYRLDLLPRLEVPDWVSNTGMPEFFYFPETDMLDSEFYPFLLMLNVMDRNQTGFNDAVDLVLASAFGKRLEDAIAVIKGLGDSDRIEIPEQLLDAFTEMVSGEPDETLTGDLLPTLGKGELMMFAGQLQVYKSMAQYLASYNWDYPIDEVITKIMNDGVENFGGPDDDITKYPNPWKTGNFLSNRSQATRTASKNTLIAALDDFRAGLLLWKEYALTDNNFYQNLFEAMNDEPGHMTWNEVLAMADELNAALGYLQAALADSTKSVFVEMIIECEEWYDEHNEEWYSECYFAGLAFYDNPGGTDDARLEVKPSVLFDSAVLSLNNLFDTNTFRYIVGFEIEYRFDEGDWGYSYDWDDFELYSEADMTAEDFKTAARDFLQAEFDKIQTNGGEVTYLDVSVTAGYPFNFDWLNDLLPGSGFADMAPAALPMPIDNYFWLSIDEEGQSPDYLSPENYDVKMNEAFNNLKGLIDWLMDN